MLERLGRGRDPRLLDAALEADFHLHESMIESMENALIGEVYRVNYDKIRLIRLNSRFTFERVPRSIGASRTSSGRS